MFVKVRLDKVRLDKVRLDRLGWVVIIMPKTK
jgi:hypothetical protein